MALIIAYASGPKGGTGKSTDAIHSARVFADCGLKVLVVDADDAHTIVDVVARGDDDHFPFDVADAVGQIDQLGALRKSADYDVVIVDLPGAKAGAFLAMLAGTDGRPVADLLVLPCRPRFIEVQPIVRAIDHEVVPAGIPYLLVLGIVHTNSVHLAEARRDELRSRELHGKPAPIVVADTIVRDFIVYDEANEIGRTVFDMPGRRSYARAAEIEQRALAREVLSMLDHPAARKL